MFASDVCVLRTPSSGPFVSDLKTERVNAYKEFSLYIPTLANEQEVVCEFMVERSVHNVCAERKRNHLDMIVCVELNMYAIYVLHLYRRIQPQDVRRHLS